MGGPANAIYPMTKAAVLCLTESLYTHLEMTGTRVRAHVLFPSGFLNTGIWESWRHRPARYAATQKRRTPQHTLADVVARFEAAGRVSSSPRSRRSPTKWWRESGRIASGCWVHPLPARKS
ncbi:putative short chain dehydrogenase/reductase [Mycobacterium xenopi 3993]|nr:putative short chain dehydrogenase/reductase [Mycobacterium xenopi 3993]